jgi:hypothetical protein
MSSRKVHQYQITAVSAAVTIPKNGVFLSVLADPDGTHIDIHYEVSTDGTLPTAPIQFNVYALDAAFVHSIAETQKFCGVVKLTAGFFAVFRVG